MIKKLLLIGVLLSPFGQAQELSRSTAQRVQKAYQLAQDSQLPQAISMLESMSSARAYDSAYIARMLGVFYWQNEQPKAAVKQLEVAVNSGLLDPDIRWDSERMLADLLLTEQQYQQALLHYYSLNENIPVGKKADILWLRIAQSHYQIKQWDGALKGIDHYLQLDKQDSLAALSLRLGAVHQLKQWQQVLTTLERLIKVDVDEAKWWRQLVAIQLQLSNEQAALNTLALAKLQGIKLTRAELRLLAQLYAKQGIPERAAQQMAELTADNNDPQYLLEQASYWQMAREWEKAISLWRRAALQDSQYYWDLATLLVQQQHYQASLAALDKVQGKDAQVALTKAQVYFKLDKIEDALFTAKNADSLQPSQQTKDWIKYLSQISKQQQLLVN